MTTSLVTCSGRKTKKTTRRQRSLPVPLMRLESCVTAAGSRSLQLCTCSRQSGPAEAHLCLAGGLPPLLVLLLAACFTQPGSRAWSDCAACPDAKVPWNDRLSQAQSFVAAQTAHAPVTHGCHSDSETFTAHRLLQCLPVKACMQQDATAFSAGGEHHSGPNPCQQVINATVAMPSSPLIQHHLLFHSRCPVYRLDHQNATTYRSCGMMFQCTDFLLFCFIGLISVFGMYRRKWCSSTLT